jgi:glycosyltransferase involved in cell wall biosynthesis
MIQRELAARRGLTSTMIYNVIDFDAPRQEVDDFNADFRESFGFSGDDILILQPTRVVSRKGIEQAIYLVKELDLPQVKLLISHSAGDEGTGYQDWLMDTASREGIPIHFLSNRLHDSRRYDETGRKLYTLWDVYPHADLITYPSLYEGFGNAFLEAVYFRKPLLVNRYSVYVVDIEPKGFDTVAIDGFLTRDAVDRVRALLLDPERRREMTDRNFEIARRFFSYRVLEQRLTGLLQSFFGASPEVARGSDLLP